MRAASAEIITLKTKGLDLFFLVICESALNETYVFAFFVNLNISSFNINYCPLYGPISVYVIVTFK